MFKFIKLTEMSLKDRTCNVYVRTDQVIAVTDDGVADGCTLIHLATGEGYLVEGELTDVLTKLGHEYE